ncbi:MAG: DUF4430 domain-containing protein [Clostridia bacterium]|nr:DUF4430 domain-containing protein [Clostridia bacterium]
MKKRICTALLLLFLFAVSALCPVSGAGEIPDGKAEQAAFLCEELLNGQLQRAGVLTPQEWVDGPLLDAAGNGSEWFVIALRQWKELDYSGYSDALLTSLRQTESNPSPTSWQKYALTLFACGLEDVEDELEIQDTIGAQGVMSWIYGIHLLNNGIASETCSLSEACGQLLSLRTEDGGWAVFGTMGDVDVTAMAIQALAPSCTEFPEVREAVDHAVEFLSLRQNPSGGFSSFGAESAESTAQVILALSSLGIDCTADERFRKDGEDLLDVLERYRLSDGSYSHTEGGESNQTATVQVFSALIAYLRMAEGKSPFYILDRPETRAEPGETDPVPESDTEPQSEKEEPSAQEEPEVHENSSGWDRIRIWASLFLFGAGIVTCVILFLRGKRTVKNYLIILAGCTGLAVLLLLARIQLPEEYYASATAEKAEPVGVVTISIRCDTIEDRSSPVVPDDGILLAETEWEIRLGDTVYTVLSEVTAARRIALDKTGSAESAYIRGIGYLYEQEYGPLSGWMYEVNGESPMIGCGQYVCLDGDRIEWIYTCNLGEDLRSETESYCP